MNALSEFEMQMKRKFAASGLLPAVKAVVEGKRFVSEFGRSLPSGYDLDYYPANAFVDGHAVLGNPLVAPGMDALAITLFVTRLPVEKRYFDLKEHEHGWWFHPLTSIQS